MLKSPERLRHAARGQRHFPWDFLVCGVFKPLSESRGRQAARSDIEAKYFP
jgi:hypothetical protein